MKINPRIHLLPLLVGGALLNSACTTMQQERATGAYGTSYYDSDAGLADRVEQALLSQPGVSLKNVKVETFQGTVQLSGQVDSHTQAVRTLATINRVDGVKAVRNYLVEAAPRPVVGPATVIAQAPNTPHTVVVASSGATHSEAK